MSPGRPKEPVAQRFWKKVNKTEACWDWTAKTDSDGYGHFWNGERHCMAHRYSFELATGRTPIQHIDHICHNRSCVNPAHLREVTRKQNMENRAQQQVNNTSGYRGVFFHKSTQMWLAAVTHNGKQLQLGLFKDPAEAGEVAKAKRLELFTHNEIDRQQQQAS